MTPNIVKLLMNAHVLLAGFFLVPAIMFSVTGSLYTYNIKGTQKSTNWSFPADVADPGSLAELVGLAEAQLAARNLSLPTGSASMKKMGTSWSLEWTGTDKDFVIEPTGEAGVLKATLKEASWYRYFVQLHKAKGSWYFKVIAAGLAFSFLMLFLSGVLMAWRIPHLKKKFLIALGSGSLLFVVAAYLS